MGPILERSTRQVRRAKQTMSAVVLSGLMIAQAAVGEATPPTTEASLPAQSDPASTARHMPETQRAISKASFLAGLFESDSVTPWETKSINPQPFDIPEGYFYQPLSKALGIFAPLDDISPPLANLDEQPLSPKNTNDPVPPLYDVEISVLAGGDSGNLRVSVGELFGKSVKTDAIPELPVALDGLSKDEVAETAATIPHVAQEPQLKITTDSSEVTPWVSTCVTPRTAKGACRALSGLSGGIAFSYRF